jgi:hypothetical protein
VAKGGRMTKAFQDGITTDKWPVYKVTTGILGQGVAEQRTCPSDRTQVASQQALQANKATPNSKKKY